MKLLLGSLLFTGVCWLGAAVTIPIMSNFKSKKIAKSWYPLLSIPTGETRSVAFHPFSFLALPNGNLKYSFRFPQNGRCSTEEVMLNKQGQPGDYMTTTANILRFVKTDYETYFIVYIMRGANKADTFLALAGSQPNVTPALEAKLRATATSLGISGEILHSVLLATC